MKRLRRINIWIAQCLLALLTASPLFADVKITRVANEGVIIDDGVTKIMIDGLVVERYALYGGLPPALAEQFSLASGPFARIDLALATHRHHDHNQPEFACQFLKRSTRTRMPSSPQVLDLMRERCRELVTTSPRVWAIDPQYGVPVEIEAGAAKVTAIRLSHGTGKYASLQNYGYLVEMGGLRLLHIGDAAMRPDDYALAGLDAIDLDVAFIPFWFFQPGPGAEIVEKFMNARLKLAVHIPPREMAEVDQYLKENFPEVVVLQAPGNELVISSSPDSSQEPAED